MSDTDKDLACYCEWCGVGGVEWTNLEFAPEHKSALGLDKDNKCEGSGQNTAPKKLHPLLLKALDLTPDEEAYLEVASSMRRYPPTTDPEILATRELVFLLTQD